MFNYQYSLQFVESCRDELIYRALSEGVEYMYLSMVNGDVAEFGTCSGKTAHFISACMKRQDQQLAYHRASGGCKLPLLHLFDSFQGLPESFDEAEKKSRLVSSGHWAPGALKGITPSQLFHLCTTQLDNDRLKIYEGFFDQTLQLIEPRTKFAMIHIDCDLYSSTYQVLDYLFLHNHFSDGATIYFDDWNCNQASPKYGERRAWGEITDKYGVNFSDRGEYANLGHRFFVHV